jgi:hypothetical protein
MRRLVNRSHLKFDGFARGPTSRRADLVTGGELPVRRSGREMKRNAEIALFTKPSDS